jgi:hypothetical protein
LFLGAPAFGQSPTTRVRILLVADTDGFAAKENGFANDRANMENALKEALRAQHLEDRYTLDVLEGADATPAGVLAYYRELKTESGEVLFFYYSGHGGADKSQGHFLAMKAGNLYRSELRAAMEAHHPRLLVLLTDACADYDSAPITTAQTKADREFKLASLAQNCNRVKHGTLARELLFHQRGVVDVNACQIGGVSVSDPGKGGRFTFAVIHLMNSQPNQFGTADGVVHWNTFFVAVQHETLQSVLAARQPNQVPMAFAVTTEMAHK